MGRNLTNQKISLNCLKYTAKSVSIQPVIGVVLKKTKPLPIEYFSHLCKPLSNNGRTRSLRAFSTKTVKYEAASNIYNKKVEDIEKQTFLVDKEIKNVE